MTTEIKKFIEENIDLINNNEWEEIYQKDFPIGFTKTLLDCGINPLEQGLDYIPDYFLHGCKNIKEFIVPNNVIVIGSYAFAGCTSLTDITIGSSVISIEVWAIANCKSLASITIPNSVTIIGKAAFLGCDSLASIKYNGTKEQWKNMDKGDRWNDRILATKIICSDGVIEL